MKLLIIINLLFLSFFVQAKSKFLDTINIRSGTYVDVVESAKLKARIIGYEFGIDITDKINNELELFFGASAILETGSNDVISSKDEWKPDQSLNLIDGGILYKPNNFLEFRLGALNQGIYNSPLLLASTPFAAMEQRLSFGWLYFKAQQAIPSNNKLTKRIGTVETGTPSFMMETIGIELGHKTKFKMELSHYKYDGLHGYIAVDSTSLGNTTQGIDTSAKFDYDFDGVNLYSAFRWMFNDFSIMADGQYLYNNKAPDTRNIGYLGRVGFAINKYSVFAESFRNESDSAPAFYNSKYYAHNNMMGNAGIFRFENKYITTKLRVAEIFPIRDNAIQDDTYIVSFDLFKKYDF